MVRVIAFRVLKSKLLEEITVREGEPQNNGTRRGWSTRTNKDTITKPTLPDI